MPFNPKQNATQALRAAIESFPVSVQNLYTWDGDGVLLVDPDAIRTAVYQEMMKGAVC